ncbi:hypothetical protein BBD42_23350 [Paenibacillus sp. BIHB 4019]|uniref:DUF2185 domain-containing protein n=1 Tax=Paenibacillus sp. BIHB 4019 TaxID=1870819 RepID=A0A1B2DN02_9BACL|nr:DUF2185 domain-containing protein [Paenibacillus sp. BIHB 4019]ANY69090.1 hypothetical protein BBD42_23350 [Paenibacillus sp. BIHB 4019]
MMEWTLEDVEQTSKLYPDSFFIPSAKERRSQEAGRRVRLHFTLANPGENEPRAERMWVEVTGFNQATEQYTGVLTNQPVYLKTLKLGDSLVFEPQHIARTILREGDERWLADGEKMALVSRRCLEQGDAVCWMYREAGDNEHDSGWRLFAGDEEDSYINADNIFRVQVYEMVDRDASLLMPFKGELGSAFERQGQNAAWVEVVEEE